MQSEILLVLAIIFRFSSSQISYADSDAINFTENSRPYEKRPCSTSDGNKGVCESEENCPRTRFKLTVDDICFSKRNQIFYCCSTEGEVPSSVVVQNTAENSPILENLMTGSAFSHGSVVRNTTVSKDSTTVAPASQKSRNKSPDRPAIHACKIHQPQHLSREVFVGGRRAVENQHPYMTAIGWTDSIGGVIWNCGGTVISYRFVLTAAHCTIDNGVAPDKIRVGDIDLFSEDDTKNFPPQDFAIRSITKHPDYNPSTFYNDIALIEIEGEFTYRRPLCLWMNETIPSTEGLAMGYGTRFYTGPRSNILYQGNLTFVANKECAIRTRSKELPRGILPSQICAYDPLQQVDTCQGDSGGPMIIYTEIGITTIPHIIGITSFGAFCASSIPGVYTRVNSYIEWIEKVALTEY